MNKATVGENVNIWHEEFSNIGECTIGDDSSIHSHVWIGNEVVIGKRAKVQAFCFIPPGVIIEDDVFVGPRVTFTNVKYPPLPPIKKGEKKSWNDTVVESNVSIGAGAIILPGITLHKGCVIGAGAVVTKDVEEGMTVVGNPARELKK